MKIIKSRQQISYEVSEETRKEEDKKCRKGEKQLKKSKNKYNTQIKTLKILVIIINKVNN